MARSSSASVRGFVIGSTTSVAHRTPGPVTTHVAASLRGLYGAQIPGQLALKPEWWFAGIAISIIGALAAAATSLTKALRLPLLATAQPYAWQQAQRRWLMFQSAVALAVFTAAGAFLVFGDSLVSGFAVLAALLLGAMLVAAAAVFLMRRDDRSAAKRRGRHAGVVDDAVDDHVDHRVRRVQLLGGDGGELPGQLVFPREVLVAAVHADGMELHCGVLSKSSP